MIELSKNGPGAVCVWLCEHRGERYVGPRTCYQTERGEERPSEKRLAVRADLADALARAIEQVAAQERIDAE